MKIVNNLELVHMAEIHSQARASSQYELVQNSFRHSFNNLLDNVLTYKRSNARVSHRVIERVSKYKQESASISKGCRKVGET